MSEPISSPCEDCRAMVVGYGAPHLLCDRHWREANPDGIQVKFEAIEVNWDVLESLFGREP